MQRVLIAVLANLLALAGATTVLAHENCLTIEHGDGGSPFVRATVDNRGPYYFVLDTASSGTTVNDALVRALRLPRDKRTEEAQGMGGALSVRFYKIRSLRAGPLLLRNFTAPGIPAPQIASHPISGLAGVDLFGKTLAVWSQRCVAIKSGGTRPAGPGWHPVATRWLQDWKVMVPLRIGKVRGWALLDTGAQYTTINPVFAARLGFKTARLHGGGTIEGLDGRPLPLFEAQLDEAAIGRWHWKHSAVKIGALPVFARLGAADAPLAIAGMDWLRNRQFAIDYSTHRLWQRGAH